MPFETIDVQINAIDELREVANRVNDIRHERIGKIERDIAVFHDEVSALVLALVPQLSGRDPQETVLELERRLTDLQKAFSLAAAAESKLAEVERKLEECAHAKEKARQQIERLQSAACVTSVEELRRVIVRSKRCRSLCRELEIVDKALAEDGDGLGLIDLASECAEVDLDDVAQREQLCVPKTKSGRTGDGVRRGSGVMQATN